VFKTGQTAVEPDKSHRRINVAELGRGEVIEVLQPMREPPAVGVVIDCEPHALEGNRGGRTLELERD
jgi:hypothetical protein